MSFLMVLARRLQGAGAQQDAHGADHARHDHRRGRGDHDGRARHRRAVVDRNADPGGRHQHDHGERRQLHAGRRAHGPGQRQHADAGGRAGDPRRARRAVHRARRQHARPGRGRQHELGHADPGHRRRPAADPIVADDAGRVLQPRGRRDGVEGRGARLGGPRTAVRRRCRSGRPGDPHQQPAVHRGRRDVEQGPVRHGPGPGRRGLRAVHDGDEEAARHHLHPEHHGVGGLRRRNERRPPIASRSCCAGATRWSTASATTSWCGRWRKWPACACRPPKP